MREAAMDALWFRDNINKGARNTREQMRLDPMLYIEALYSMLSCA